MQHTAKNLVIVACLIGSGFFAAYLRFRPYLGREATYTDGQATYASLRDGVRYAVWDEAVPLPPTVNTTEPESRPALSPDGLYLVFASGQAGLNRDLFIADLVDGEPQNPQPIGLLNSPSDEIAPAFARDALYFASDRAGGAGGFDLYRCDYQDGVFGIPAAVPGVNSAEDECDPFPLQENGELAFAASRERGGKRDFDLFLATPVSRDDGTLAFSAQPLEALNTAWDEREPAFTRDGITLLFASDRDGGQGSFDLYRAVRERGTLLPPQPLDGVNTAQDERAPLPSADGFTLWFAADQQGADLDLFRARSLELFRIPGKPVGWVDLLILLSLLTLALLAWLARRWETLDIIYKCFLIALLIHLLMLWYAKRVLVEGDEIDLPGRDALFQVRVASAVTDASSQRERSGALEAQVRQAIDTSQPLRSEQALPDRTPAQAPSRAVAHVERASDAAPERSTAEDLSRATEPATEPLAMADQVEALERRSGAAPTLGLGDPTLAAVTPTRTNAGDPAFRSAAAAAPNVPASAPASMAVTANSRVDAGADIDVPRDANVAVAPTGATAADAPAMADREVVARNPAGGASDATATQSAADLASGAPRFEPTPRGNDSGPARLPSTATALGPASSAAPAAPARKGALAAADPKAAPDAATARTDAPVEPTRAPGSGAAIALHDQAERSTPSATPTNASSARSTALADLTPAWQGEPRQPRRAETAQPRKHTFAVAADAPAPAPSHRPLAEVARLDAAATVKTERDMEHTPYRNRFGSEKQKALQLHGGGAETERAVADGLRYLAARQNKDGYWGSRDDYEDKYGYVCIGKSALCLLAFLGAGHTPASDTEYSAVAQRAVDFLLSVQIGDVGHFGWTSAYSHGIATYALAECHAITHDPRLVPPLQQAIAWILRNQSSSRDPRIDGGWGYYNPDGPHFDRWARVSVSSWQIMALESARLGGLEVPDDAFERARAFLKGCYDPRLRAFRYNHDPDRLASNYPTLPASTPAALFALSLVGEDITTREFAAPRRYVLDRLPAEYRCRSEQAFVEDASGNVYFWYYASLALFRCGGDDWEIWNTALKETLLPAQSKDGSWRNICPYSERACDTDEQRCYSTAMCVLTLEIYYRYFTPLLKVR